MEQANQPSSRSRRSRQQIQALLQEFEKSATTVQQFCKLHNISTGSFHKWKSRYKILPAQVRKTPGFAKLAVIDNALTLPTLFAEARGIRIYQPVSASFLNELLS